MASLVKVVKFSAKLANRQPGILYTVIRHHWNKDYKPGPIPKTPEERRKAAEKYNVHPERYEHYPDDGMGYGDYPKLPLVSGEIKDPYYPWDYPALKRNFNEPVHVFEEVINQHRCNLNQRRRYSHTVHLITFFGILGTCAGLFVYFDEPTRMMHPPVLAKPIYGQGKHYLFPGDHDAGEGGHH